MHATMKTGAVVLLGLALAGGALAQIRVPEIPRMSTPTYGSAPETASHVTRRWLEQQAREAREERLRQQAAQQERRIREQEWRIRELERQKRAGEW